MRALCLRIAGCRGATAYATGRNVIPSHQALLWIQHQQTIPGLSGLRAWKDQWVLPRNTANLSILISGPDSSAAAKKAKAAAGRERDILSLVPHIDHQSTLQSTITGFQKHTYTYFVLYFERAFTASNTV